MDFLHAEGALLTSAAIARCSAAIGLPRLLVARLCDALISLPSAALLHVALVARRARLATAAQTPLLQAALPLFAINATGLVLLLGLSFALGDITVHLLLAVARVGGGVVGEPSVSAAPWVPAFAAHIHMLGATRQAGLLTLAARALLLQAAVSLRLVHAVLALLTAAAIAV